MKFSITFRVLGSGQALPLSYQYELSSWVYHLIGNANAPFAQFLHDKGYVQGSKKFKFFNFSQLSIPNGEFKIQKDRMLLFAKEIRLDISFLVDEAAQALIMGLFQEQEFRLGDKYSQVALRVSHVECLPLPTLDSATVHFRTASPMVVSAAVSTSNNKLQHSYLSPLDVDFEAYFFQNLLQKYLTATEHHLVPPLTPTLAQQPTHFKLLSSQDRVKSRLITIKAFTPEETKIRGFLFDFELTAPPELLQIGLLAGFGTENAMGFGAVRVL